MNDEINTSKTTVVIPTLSRPHLLRRCILGVLSGDLKPELIIVCDQSNDSSTRLVAEGFQDRGVNLMYMHLPAEGTSAARNAGIKAAQTKLIAFIDDDCVPDHRWLASLYETYRNVSNEESVSGVAGRVLPLQTKKGGFAVSSRTSDRPRRFRGREGGLERADWAPWDVGTGANILAPRSMLLLIGGFDSKLGPATPARAAEDIDLIYGLARAGTLVYEPQAIVYHPTTTRQARVKSRSTYARGMGTMLGKRLLAGDPAALPLTSLYLRHQTMQALRNGIWGPVEASLTLWGALGPLARAGLRYAYKGRSARRRGPMTGISSEGAAAK
jgi:glycosyltransferase involved in cell wall biosynthesis